jgi:hypothetical protein
MPIAPNDNRKFAMDLLGLLGAPALVLVGLLYWWQPWKLARYSEASPSRFRDRVVGIWDYPGPDFCRANPHRISFSDDHQVMTLTYRRASAGFVLPQRAFLYDVSESTDSGIVATMRGETRQGANGAPVVWELFLLSKDSYAWREAALPMVTHHAKLDRCPAETDSLIPPIE